MELLLKLAPDAPDAPDAPAPTAPTAATTATALCSLLFSTPAMPVLPPPRVALAQRVPLPVAPAAPPLPPPVASHAPPGDVHAGAPSAAHAATDPPGVHASAPPVERGGDSAISQQVGWPSGPPPEPPNSTRTGGSSAAPPPHQSALSPAMQPSTHLRDYACCCLCRAALEASAVDPRSSVLCRACADLVVEESDERAWPGRLFI